MDQLANLPLPLRIAIGAGIAIVLFAILYMAGFRGDGMVAVGEAYPSQEAAEADQWRLSRVVGGGGQGIAATVVETANGRYELRVPAEAKDAAENALGSETSGLRNNEQCDEAGMLTTSSTQRRVEQCKNAREIENLLRGEQGILQAYVIINMESSSGFSSNDGATATVQLVPDPGVDLTERGTELAKTVKSGNSLLTMDTIFIRTREGQTIYDPTGTGSTGGGQLCSSSSDNIHDLNRCVEEQLESELEADLTKIVGDAERVAVLANVQLTSSMRQVNTQDIQGVLRERSQLSTRGGDATETTSTDESEQPDATISEETILPGMVEHVKLSVWLKGVDRGTEQAVRDLLGGLVIEGADEPPQVTNQPFSAEDLEAGAAASTSTTSSAGEMGADAAAAAPADGSGGDTAAADDASDERGQVINTDQSTLLTVFGVLLAVLVGALAAMWRRSRKLQAEREVFEQEFRNDMTRFQTVASRNPDELAHEIEAWLAETSPRDPAQSGQ